MTGILLLYFIIEKKARTSESKERERIGLCLKNGIKN
jgi:hypothetical protein